MIRICDCRYQEFLLDYMYCKKGKWYYRGSSNDGQREEQNDVIGKINTVQTLRCVDCKFLF